MTRLVDRKIATYCSTSHKRQGYVVDGDHYYIGLQLEGALGWMITAFVVCRRLCRKEDRVTDSKTLSSYRASEENRD